MAGRERELLCELYVDRGAADPTSVFNVNVERGSTSAYMARDLNASVWKRMMPLFAIGHCFS